MIAQRTLLCPLLIVDVDDRSGRYGGGGDAPNPNVVEMLRKLNLIEEEEAVVDFNEEEDEEVLVPLE